MRPLLVRERISPLLVRTAEGHSSTWAQVRMGASNDPARGDGLFAAEDIRAYTRLDYYGVRRTKRSLYGVGGEEYCVGLQSPDVIDANPRWYSAWDTSAHPAWLPRTLRHATRLPAGIMIGGLVNEPSRHLDEFPNMKLFSTRREAYFVAVRDICAGEELLTLYGEYVRPTWDSPVLWLDPEPLADFLRFREPAFSLFREQRRRRQKEAQSASAARVIAAPAAAPDAASSAVVTSMLSDVVTAPPTLSEMSHVPLDFVIREANESDVDIFDNFDDIRRGHLEALKRLETNGERLAAATALLQSRFEPKVDAAHKRRVRDAKADAERAASEAAHAAKPELYYLDAEEGL